jgi:hypothetical protein
MPGIDLYELRRQFARWGIGTWFELDDSLIGWQGKDRPFVLIVDYDGGPLATGSPRSASRASAFTHQAHPAAHEGGCRIDQAGWIHTRIRAPLEAEWLADSYMCTEPDPQALKRLREVQV